MSLEKQILEYLAEAKIMQLATSQNGRPWICNVWFAFDNDMNIYWLSAKNRRHSKELKDNPYTAISICWPRSPEESDKGALQIEGCTEELKNSLDISRAMKLYLGRRFFTTKQIKDFITQLDRPHRFYRLKPERIVLFSPVQKEVLQEYIPKT